MALNTIKINTKSQRDGYEYLTFYLVAARKKNKTQEIEKYLKKKYGGTIEYRGSVPVIKRKVK